jgi:hypothetical protein
VATKHGSKKPKHRRTVSPARERKAAMAVPRMSRTDFRGADGKKEEVALQLAQGHFKIEPGISRIFRLVSDAEASDDEPIKLLEVNENTTTMGIVPIRFGPNIQAGIPYQSIIVEIDPSEYASLKQGVLALPTGWRLGEEYQRKPVRRR